MCSTEFTIQAEFTVHSAGLSMNSADLSAKSVGWGFHCLNFESNGFRPVFTKFYRIRPIFPKTGGIGGSRFFSLRRFFKHWLQVTLPDGLVSAHEILQFITVADCYLNASVAYRILLTISVTVASAEISFSKLKLLKNHLGSTMSQDRLNGLATCSIEKDI
jgi:hypothetical protein